MPIMVAGGEHIVPPDAISHVGLLALIKEHGEKALQGITGEELKKKALSKGHKLLDQMVKNVRRHVIQRLKTLPDPKK
jgi:hypothetical protein